MENKWLTREEFESKYNNGYCWIVNIDDYVDMVYFYKGDYYDAHNDDSRLNKDLIKAVMPIEKPKFPTLVGKDIPKEI